nr:MAG TPA: hypothetical protein [Caudoviricetes sp.]
MIYINPIKSEFSYKLIKLKLYFFILKIRTYV